MPRLIVNADDFGMTRGINQAIAELAALSAVTSATLMANAPHAEEAAALAKANPRLGLGCHLVFVDGAPLCDPAQVPSLLEPGTQRFFPTLGGFLRALFLGRLRTNELVLETTAQIERVRALGIQPTHVDTHKHTHMFPQVLEAVIAAASKAGIPALRNPFEPAWAVTNSAGARTQRKIEVRMLSRMYRQRFLEQARSSRLRTTDGAIGVVATGSLDAATVSSLLRDLPEETWELVCHPGYCDADLLAAPTRLRESRAVELRALESIRAVAPSNTQFISYGDLLA